MNSSILRGLATAAMAAVALGSLGCPSPGGKGKAHVARVDPPEGAAAGGLTVFVVGSNFEGGPASVYFDGVPATDVEVLSDTEIRCVTPPGAIGLADVEVRSSGNVGKKVRGFEYLPGVEAKEAANDTGGNDTFPAYERMPIDYDFQAYIGTQDDVDVFHFHPPKDGKVYVSLSFDASFASGGIASMQVEYYQGPDPTPDPDAYFAGTVLATSDGVTPGAPSITDWMRPAFLIAGAHGPYLRIRAFGDGNHAGFDPVNPYTVRVHFEPDPTFEPAPQADSFRVAIPINPAAAPVQLANNAAYDDDYDWYKFTVPADGWARVTISAEGLGTVATNGELAVSAKLFWIDPADPDGNHVYGVAGAAATAVDLPGPTGRVFEVATLQALQTYALRLTNSNESPGTAGYDYGVTVEYGAGGLEADEPGSLLPAERPDVANDLGVLTAGNSPIVVTGYLFHEGDDDWFTFTAPPGGGDVLVEWDHTPISTELGFYDPGLNPFGGEFSLLAFDTAWFNTGGQLAITTETVGGTAFDATPATDVKSVTITGVNPSETYYVLVNGVRGWSTGQAYQLSLTLQ